MTDAYPFLLVVVEGPSEAVLSPEGGRGVVTRLIGAVFGPETARALQTQYLRHVVASPLRARSEAQPKGLTGHALKAWIAARVGDRTTAYGTVLLVDADGHADARLEAQQRGAEASGCRVRVALGVATQMVEAWLLADPALLGLPLPAGKTAETLWGDKHDGHSNYPKHVLRRCVLEPKGWSYQEVEARWSPMTARAHAPSLDAFVAELLALARSQGVA